MPKGRKTDMKNFSFEGSLELNGHKEPFVGSIEAPEPSAEEADEYTCVVRPCACSSREGPRDLWRLERG